MQEKEKQLFKALCKFNDETIDEDLLKYATPTVLGYLFFNRMQGIAFDKLRKNNLLGKVNREFRNSLAAAYDQNVQKNNSFYMCIAMLSEILSNSQCRIAMLKGAYLCGHYPLGYRTSNDVDLLVSPQDVTIIGKLLADAGFKQGNIRDGVFISATRREIIESKMMRGETVPYIKEVNLPFMKYFEVDINFSLDFKNGNEDILMDMLSKVRIKSENNLSVPMLDDSDFFIHLCSHLYKEATTLPWIEMKRDMTLYKYCDIYLLLSEMTDIQIQLTFQRAKELHMDFVCAYTVLETIDFFNLEMKLAKQEAISILMKDPNYRLTVVSPKDKKMYIYQTSDVSERFFMESRINDLKEIEYYEKT